MPMLRYAAPKNGWLKAFCYAAGDQVADGAQLVDFEVEVGR